MGCVGLGSVKWTHTNVSALAGRLAVPQQYAGFRALPLLGVAESCVEKKHSAEIETRGDADTCVQRERPFNRCSLVSGRGRFSHFSVERRPRKFRGRTFAQDYAGHTRRKVKKEAKCIDQDHICRNHFEQLYRQRSIGNKIRAQKNALSLNQTVLFSSRPRSEGWPHHGHTFSNYLCPLSF